MLALNEGWNWDGENFVFVEIWRVEDIESGKSDQERTTLELVKAMSSIFDFIQFEGEDPTMFSDLRIPTLDMTI